MSGSSLLLRLFVVFACYITILARTRGEFILSRCGYQIPRRLIQRHFRKRLTLGLIRSKVLYEIYPKYLLTGPELQLHVFEDTQEVIEEAPIGFSLSVNGKGHETHQRKSIFRQGKGYTVHIAQNDSQILAVWGPGMHLKPIDESHFRDVFVNVRAFSSSEGEISWDENFKYSGNAQSEHENKALRSFFVRQGSSCIRGALHYLKVAVAYDNSYCRLFGNDQATATAAIRGVVNTANIIFSRNTCVRLILSHVEAHCRDSRDPYAYLANIRLIPCSNYPCEASGRILDVFSNFWNIQRNFIRRDVAYFFSGFSDGTSTGGIASLGGACSKTYGYGWVEAPAPGQLLFAHEIGHSLSADHTNYGIMKPAVSPTDNFFAPQSVWRITNFIDNDARARCMQTSIQPSSFCDDTCSIPCTNGKCEPQNSSSIPNSPPKSQPPSRGVLSCSLINPIYKCTKWREINGIRYFTSDCPSGYNFVSRKRNPDNRSVFCCRRPSASIRANLVPWNTRRAILVVTYPNGTVFRFPNYVMNPNDVSRSLLIRSTRVVCPV